MEKPKLTHALEDMIDEVNGDLDCMMNCIDKRDYNNMVYNSRLAHEKFGALVNEHNHALWSGEISRPQYDANLYYHISYLRDRIDELDRRVCALFCK